MAASTVSFKAAHHNVGVVDIRLLQFEATPPPTWDAVAATLKERFEIPDGIKVVLKYDDVEGDVISLSTTSELHELWPPSQKIFFIESLIASDGPPPLLPLDAEGELAYLPPETPDERAAFLDCLEHITLPPGSTNPSATEDEFWRDIVRIVDRRVSGGLAQIGFVPVVKKNKPTFVGVGEDEFDKVQQQESHLKEIKESARRFEERQAGMPIPSAIKNPWTSTTSRPSCFGLCGGSHGPGVPCTIYGPHESFRRPADSELSALSIAERRRAAREYDSRLSPFLPPPPPLPSTHLRNLDYGNGFGAGASPRPQYSMPPYSINPRTYALPSSLQYDPAPSASYGGRMPRSSHGW